MSGDDTRRSDTGQGPYRLGGLLSTSWRFYLACFWPLLVIFVLVNLPLMGAALLRVSDLYERALFLTTLIFVAHTVLVSLAVGAAANVLEGHLQDAPVGVAEAWRGFKGSIAAAVGAGLVSSLLFLSVGQIFPPLVALVYGPPMLMQVIAVERPRTLVAAWVRTKGLMSGHWGRVLTYLLTTVLGVFVVFNLAASAAIAAAGDMDAAPRSALITSLIALVAAFTYPFLAAVQYVAYADIAALEESSPAKKGRSTSATGPESGPPSDPPEERNGDRLDERPSHYEVLGIKPHATQKQIRRAHARWMKLTDLERHPDADDDQKTRLTRAREAVQEAFAALGDPGSRQAYDAELEGRSGDG